MKYLEQTHKDIRLYTLCGSPNVDQFTVIAAETITILGITVHFGILGASHFVSFETQNEKFTEICACVSGDFSSEEVLTSGLFFHKITEPISQITTSFNYNFTCSIIKATEASTQKRELFHTGADSLFLSYNFPTVENQAEPLTYIKISHKDRVIITETLHTYPNEEIDVFTRSTISLSQSYE
jgi:Protein of unknown function DUF2617